MKIVYKIECLINNRMYIGSTVNFMVRKSSHLSTLKKNNHRNSDLQNDFNKYGIDNFSFTIIEECDGDIIECEQKHISKNIKLLYNKKYAKGDKNKKRLKYSKASKYNKGNKNPNSALTIEDCILIKEELLKPIKNGWMEKYKEIASKFNVSDSTIKDIKLGKHWSNKKLGGSFKRWKK
jgi:group I intron endonuclease